MDNIERYIGQELTDKLRQRFLEHVQHRVYYEGGLINASIIDDRTNVVLDQNNIIVRVWYG